MVSARSGGTLVKAMFMRSTSGKVEVAQSASELLEHHERIDVAAGWVPESERQTSHDLETQRLPEVHGKVVRADDEVERKRGRVKQQGRRPEATNN
jgi:hypothetical protein